MATTIILVRHGETDWNREHRFQGHADPPLNERGRAQANALAEQLAGESFATAYSSPLRRALETAGILAGRLGVHFEPRDRLKEVDVGSWTGLTTTDVEERFPDGFRHWSVTRAGGWTDGETYEALGARVMSELLELAELNAGEHILAVTHGGAIRSVLAAAAGVSLGSGDSGIGFVENCAAVWLAARDGKLERVD